MEMVEIHNLYHRSSDNSSGVAAFVRKTLGPVDIKSGVRSASLAFTAEIPTVSGKKSVLRVRLRYVPFLKDTVAQMASHAFRAADAARFNSMPALECGDCNVPGEELCQQPRLLEIRPSTLQVGVSQRPHAICQGRRGVALDLLRQIVLV